VSRSDIEIGRLRGWRRVTSRANSVHFKAHQLNPDGCIECARTWVTSAQHYAAFRFLLRTPWRAWRHGGSITVLDYLGGLGVSAVQLLNFLCASALIDGCIQVFTARRARASRRITARHAGV